MACHASSLLPIIGLHKSPRHAARVRGTQREPEARSESPRHARLSPGSAPGNNITEIQHCKTRTTTARPCLLMVNTPCDHISASRTSSMHASAPQVCWLSHLALFCFGHYGNDDADALAKWLVREVHGIFGVPKVFLSDSDVKSASDLFQAVHKELGVEIELGAPRHGKTSGVVENRVKTIMDGLNIQTARAKDQGEDGLGIYLACCMRSIRRRAR